MKLDQTHMRFFLGANTPQGFVSRFDQLCNLGDGWRQLVIKGGPGSGKSTMIKKIAEAMAEKDKNMEFIICSSDVDSLDGVIVPQKKFCIVDGTPPHTVEPQYPGAVESIVDVSSCWDADKLYDCREEIIRLTKACTRCHEYCCRFLSAAGSLAADTYRLALDCVNTQKLAGYCGRLAEKELKPVKNTGAKEQVRFLTAVTNKGVVKFEGTIKLCAKRVYLVNDEYGAVSRLILSGMRAKALAAGYDVISCYCPLAPFDKLEQLFIPALDVAFITSNRFHDFNMDVDAYRIINSQRFTDTEKLKKNKKRLSFNRKATAQMVAQAEALLKEAKAHHDELEAYYSGAMDFEKLNALTAAVLKRIESF